MQGLLSKWEALSKWMRSSEGKKEISEAKKDAWVPFDKEFPNADKSKFVSQAEVVAKGNVSAEIFLKKGPICRACSVRTENIGAMT